MAELTPIPFSILATRLFSELEARKAAFDLPERFCYAGSGSRDLSLQLHGQRASTPFGPAAGPHTQMAQNIVLAWLCGGRFMELKTVQIKDDLHIPRPCIDMQTVGSNIEWSGVKFSNTLLVKNHKTFFPATEAQMYMSGVPLHVLAMALVQRFRSVFGDRFPVSFSAGIDESTVADAVALGLKPVTVCSDLLKAGGYARAIRYLRALEARMDAVGARTIDEFIIAAFGHGEPGLQGLRLSSERVEGRRQCRRSSRCAPAADDGPDPHRRRRSAGAQLREHRPHRGRGSTAMSRRAAPKAHSTAARRAEVTQ